MKVSCPHCGNNVPFTPRPPEEQGVIRLTCDNCQKVFRLKVSRPDLKLKADDPEASRPSAPSGSATDPPRPPPLTETTHWTLSVSEFPEESLPALRAVLTQVPRYSRNPNKVFDLTEELPYEFPRLTSEETRRLEICLAACGAQFQTSPGP
jgi:hypothetical protein